MHGSVLVKWNNWQHVQTCVTMCMSADMLSRSSRLNNTYSWVYPIIAFETLVAVSFSAHCLTVERLPTQIHQQQVRDIDGYMWEYRQRCQLDELLLAWNAATRSCMAFNLATFAAASSTVGAEAAVFFVCRTGSCASALTAWGMATTYTKRESDHYCVLSW